MKECARDLETLLMIKRERKRAKNGDEKESKIKEDSEMDRMGDG